MSIGGLIAFTVAHLFQIALECLRLFDKYSQQKKKQLVVQFANFPRKVFTEEFELHRLRTLSTSIQTCSTVQVGRIQ